MYRKETIMQFRISKCFFQDWLGSISFVQLISIDILQDPILHELLALIHPTFFYSNLGLSEQFRRLRDWLLHHFTWIRCFFRHCGNLQTTFNVLCNSYTSKLHNLRKLCKSISYSFTSLIHEARYKFSFKGSFFTVRNLSSLAKESNGIYPLVYKTLL